MKRASRMCKCTLVCATICFPLAGLAKSSADLKTRITSQNGSAKYCENLPKGSFASVKQKSMEIKDDIKRMAVTPEMLGCLGQDGSKLFERYSELVKTDLASIELKDCHVLDRIYTELSAIQGIARNCNALFVLKKFKVPSVKFDSLIVIKNSLKTKIVSNPEAYTSNMTYLYFNYLYYASIMPLSADSLIFREKVWDDNVLRFIWVNACHQNGQAEMERGLANAATIFQNMEQEEVDFIMAFEDVFHSVTKSFLFGLGNRALYYSNRYERTGDCSAIREFFNIFNYKAIEKVVQNISMQNLCSNKWQEGICDAYCHEIISDKVCLGLKSIIDEEKKCQKLNE